MVDKVQAINSGEVKKKNPWEDYMDSFNKAMAVAQSPNKIDIGNMLNGSAQSHNTSAGF